MKVAKNLDRRLELFDEHGLCLEHLGDLVDKLEYLFSLNVEWAHRGDGGLTLTRLQQVLNEERVKTFVVIFLDQRRLDIRAKLTRLFLQFID